MYSASAESFTKNLLFSKSMKRIRSYGPNSTAEVRLSLLDMESKEGRGGS